MSEKMNKFLSSFNAKKKEDNILELSNMKMNLFFNEDEFSELFKRKPEFGTVGPRSIDGKNILYLWYSSPGRDYGTTVYSEQELNDLQEAAFSKMTHEELCDIYEGDEKARNKLKQIPEYMELESKIKEYDIIADTTFGWWGI